MNWKNQDMAPLLSVCAHHMFFFILNFLFGNCFFEKELSFQLKPKAIIAGITENPAAQILFIHFFIDNSNANVSLYTLSCPKLKFEQLKVYKLMFALELSMKK